MKLKNLIEATEKVDMNFREKSEELADYCFNYITKDNNANSLLNVFYYDPTFAKIVIIHPKYDIDIYFLLENSLGTGGIGTKNGVYQISLYGFQTNLSQPTFRDMSKIEALTHIINILKNNKHELKQAIFHECIHILDFERADEVPDEEDVNDYEWDEYVNDSFELNAFYQQAIKEFESNLINKQAIQSLFQIKDFDWFKDFIFKKAYYKDVIDELTDANRKRLIKRLWNYYSEHKQGKY